jgi:hypothetical protein
MPHEVVRHSTRLFGEKVMPKLRNLWPDYADDNRFWCRPIANRRHPDRELKGVA